MVSEQDRGRREEADDRAGGLQTDRYIGREVSKIGNSQGVTLPANWLRRLGLDSDDVVDLEADFSASEIVLKLRS